MTNHPWIIVLAVAGVVAIVGAIVLYLVYKRSLSHGAMMVLSNTGNVATRYELHGEDLVGLRYTFSSDARPIQMIRALNTQIQKPRATKKVSSPEVSAGTDKIKAGRKGLRTASKAATGVNRMAMFLPSDVRKTVMGATGQVRTAEGKVQKVESTQRRVESVAGRATKVVPGSKTATSIATTPDNVDADIPSDETVEAIATYDLGRTPVLEPGNKLKVSCAIGSPMRVRQRQIEYRIVSVAMDRVTDKAVLEGVYDASQAASLRLWSIVLAALGIIWGGYALYWLLTYGI